MQFFGNMKGKCKLDIGGNNNNSIVNVSFPIFLTIGDDNVTKKLM